MKFKLFFYLFVLFMSCAYSQSIYNKDISTIIADSLQREGNYKRAILFRKKALNQKNALKDYQTYLEAKYYHSKSCYYEFESYSYHNLNKTITKKTRELYLDSALQMASKARDLYINVKKPDRKFQYDLQNRIYHQTAYLGNWKHALEEAQLGLKILKDTLTEKDKTFVDLIYDIGFIYGKLGDYSKAVNNYQASLNLYKNSVGENNTDVAQAYNNIAVEYRGLGLRKKELESLLKAKSIWEYLKDENDNQFLYRCYGNLFYWYSYYGDFDNAEAYILKKKNLRESKFATQDNGFLRNKEEIYEDKLSEWYDLMLHYSRKKDTLNTILYANNIIKTINPDKPLLNFEVNILCSTLKFRASLYNNKNKEDALKQLNQAIKIQKKYKEVYYLNPFLFQLDKVELLLESDRLLEAETLLGTLKASLEEQEISNRFKYNILTAKTAQFLKKTNIAKYYFDTAFRLLKIGDKELEKLTLNDLKPLISFETIEGFLAMGDFYTEYSKKEQSQNNIKKAIHRYFLASKIYNQLYLGQRYNDRLFEVNNAINDRLLNATLNVTRNEGLLIEVINSIENNSSKLTWSKFVFNNKRQQFNLSERLISEEENVKAQLNFYQNTILNSDNDSQEKISIWKQKIFELNEALTKVQDSIKEQNKFYYQLNIKEFNVTKLQTNLKDGEAVIKYVMTDKQMFSFLITKSNVKLLAKTEKKIIIPLLKLVLNDLKNREHTQKNLLIELKNLLFSQIKYQDLKKLTIIPDGALCFLPFEILIWDQKMPLVSYASSLLLYNEQIASKNNFEDVKMGAFSASNSNIQIPNASKEINSIIKIFKGNTFLNASKAEFLNKANQFNVLHLAMHSYIDEEQPEYSSLNFYGDTDNRLLISELYNEYFKSNMVVLSACDTGSGFYENGEGVISISRAFNYAGIPSTVMSLWKVDDEATAKIMTYFYEHLKMGESKDEALKNAKLEYLKNTDDILLKHPYYWSGFVLSGNTDALIETHNYWYYVLILPILFLGIFKKRLFKFFNN